MSSGSRTSLIPVDCAFLQLHIAPLFVELSACFFGAEQLIVLKRGMSKLLSAGLVLACLCSTLVRAELRIDETIEKSGPWTIGYNSSRKECVASGSFDGGITVWIGFDGSEAEMPAYLAFSNPNWVSIEPRKFYDLQIQVSGSHRWRGYASGVARPNEKALFVFGVKRRFLEELAQASELVLSLNNEVLARSNVSGASDAIVRLTACRQDRMLAAKSQPVKASGSVEAPAWEGASREQAEPERGARERQGEKQPEKAAPHPAPLPAPIGPAAAGLERKAGEIVRAIKQELKRVARRKTARRREAEVQERRPKIRLHESTKRRRADSD